MSKKSANAFRTISEVAEDLGLPQHVLRFWETKFPSVKPMKRGGGRRYYRPEDLELISRIRDLLRDQGYTIKGVQKLLRQHGPKGLIALGRAGDGISVAASQGRSVSQAPSASRAPLPLQGATVKRGAAIRKAILDLERAKELLLAV